MKIADTQTKTNLLIAFAAESRAQCRYKSFADRAIQEGYRRIAEAFKHAADREAMHAMCILDFLGDTEPPVFPEYRPQVAEPTMKNLIAAAREKNHLSTRIYPQFALLAELQGLLGIADLFRNLAVAEYWHEETFLELLAEMNETAALDGQNPLAWTVAPGFYFDPESDQCSPIVQNDVNSFTLVLSRRIDVSEGP